MPIARDRRECLESDTCMMQVTYSDTDVRKALVTICRVWCADGIATGAENWTESELRYSLAKVITKDLTDNSAEYLAKWAFKLSLRKKYIKQSASDKNMYFFSEMIIKKSGTGGNL